MRMTGTDSLRCLLGLGLMSGLVACGSFANCFNSGFASVACGGGYSASDVSSLPQPTPTSAEGRWTGMTPTGRTVVGLVLDDGSYWLFYTARDNPTVLAGLVQGTGTSHFGSFGSSNTRDFDLEGAGIRAGTMNGSYVPNKSFHGTIVYFNGDMENFTSTYDADSESAPNLTLVAGTYAGLRADHHTVMVTVDAAGTLSGHSSDGCTRYGDLVSSYQGPCVSSCGDIRRERLSPGSRDAHGGGLVRCRDQPAVQCSPQPCQDHQLSLSGHEAVRLTGSLSCPGFLF